MLAKCIISTPSSSDSHASQCCSSPRQRILCRSRTAYPQAQTRQRVVGRTAGSHDEAPIPKTPSYTTPCANPRSPAHNQLGKNVDEKMVIQGFVYSTTNLSASCTSANCDERLLIRHPPCRGT